MATAEELVKAAKERTKEQESFPVPFMDTEILFRVPADAVEHEAIKRNAEKEIFRVQKTPSVKTAPFKTLPGEVIRQAYWIHKLAVDPPFAMHEALELQEAGSCLSYLFQSVMLKVGETLVVEERQIVDDEKNA